MKKISLIFLVSWLLWACNDSVTVKVNVDSTSTKIEDKAERIWDSTKKGAEELKEKVDRGLDKADSAFDAKRDSLRKKKIG
ncbi:MAG: hypothetical protein ACJ75F_09960 [Flavisolibacter sp.]|jgi:hypothetical protein